MVLNILGGVILLVIFVGLAFRHHRRVHVPIMLAAFVADVSMVLYIELTRGAVEQALAPDTRMLVIHVVFSVVAMAGWLVQLGSGIRLYRTGRGRDFHKLGAAVFLVARSGNFVTSWLI